MSPQGEALKVKIMKNKNYIKPRYCRNSVTLYCICKSATECAVIDCGEGAVLPWGNLNE